MRIERLHVEWAPGLGDGLPPLELPSGFVVVVGPNASGKSTLARALRALLWPDEADSRAQVSSLWQVGEGKHRGELFAGRVLWQPALPVSVPPAAAGLARFGMRSLLAADDARDRTLAQEVARELAGGLDLQAASKQFVHSPRLAGNARLARDLKEAREGLGQAIRRTNGLATAEDHQAQLDEQIEAAKAAARSKGAAEALRNLVLAAGEVARLEAEGAAFSVGLDRLVGDEDKRIRELDRSLSGAQCDLADLQVKLEELGAKAEENAFPGDSPGRDELDAWNERLDQFAITAGKVDDLCCKVDTAAQRLEETSAEVVDDIDEADLSLTTLDELAASIAEVRDAQGEVTAYRRAVATWDSWAQGAEEDPTPLREAVNSLRAWLRSAEDGVSTNRAAPLNVLAWVLNVAGLICFGIAVAASSPWFSAGLLLTGLGAGLLLSGRRRADTGGASGALAAHRQAVARTGLAPRSWETSAVESHLIGLETRLGRVEQAHRARDQLVEARRALEEAEREVQAGTAGLRKSAARAGASEEFVDLGAVQQVHALIRWLDARAEHADRSAELKQAQLALSEGLRAHAAWLGPHGFEAPADVAAARAAMREVENRRTDLLDTHEKLKEARQARQRQVQAREEIEKELASIWECTGAEHGDVAALALRLEERLAWAEYREALRDAQRDLQGCRKRFVGAGDLPSLDGVKPESVAVEQVNAWIESFTEKAGRLEDFSDKRGRIREKVSSATQGRDMSDALAREREAKQAVAAERGRAAEDALARMLLDEAHETHEAAHAPPVLLRAQERFGRFTNGGWRLEVDREGALRAHDVGAGESRSLEELSDGTRVQLLLAARLAALEELEPGDERVPICLDESLASTDPVRFRAIAEALLGLADGGRQVLYFTADPGEAAQWRQACTELGRPEPPVVDLAVLRGEPADWGGELPALPPEPELVPDPAGQTPADYARALGVAPPDGFRNVASWHLYFVAHDDLEALAACLRRCLTTVGHWCESRRRGSAPPEVSAETAQRLDARASLGAALPELWRIGRGRPVTWDDVNESGAVSAVFEEGVQALLAEHARDPKRFVAEVRVLEFFRSAKAIELEEHLEQAGCLPTEDTLLSGDIVRRCLQATPEATERLGPPQAAVYVEWLLSLLEV